MAEEAIVEKNAPAQAEEEKPKKRAVSRKKATRKGEKVTITKSKRKTSVARAYIKSGNGTIKINGKGLEAIEFNRARDMLMEPFIISSAARELSKKVNIKVNVYGGGISSQVQAARGAIARGLVAFSGSESMKGEFMDYDRSLMVDDSRRVEPKKFRGPKARARFQTSYR